MTHIQQLHVTRIILNDINIQLLIASYIIGQVDYPKFQLWHGKCVYSSWILMRRNWLQALKDVVLPEMLVHGLCPEKNYM